MSVNLSPVAGAAAQFLDNSGNVLTGGKLYTYAAGTTTPQATYTSGAGVTFHTNPIILDAAGRVPNGGEIWLTDGLQYKFVLKDANDVLIGTWDNLIGINSNFLNYYTQEETQTATQGQTVFTLATVTYTPGTNSLSVYVNGSKQIVSVNYYETDSTTVTFASGLNVGDVVDFTTAVTLSSGVTTADLVTYDPPFTGSTPTTVETKLSEILSVKDFGAQGDGVTNDTVAIANAIAATPAYGTVYFPPGVYVGRMSIRKSNISIVGAGSASTKVIMPAGVNSIVCELGDTASGNSATAYTNINVSGFTFDGNYTNTPVPADDLTGHAMITTKISYSTWTDLICQNAHTTCFDTVINSNYNHVDVTCINGGNSLVGGGYYPNFDINSSKYSIYNVISQNGKYGGRMLANCWSNTLNISVNNASIIGVTYNNQASTYSYGNTIVANTIDCGQGMVIGDSCFSSTIILNAVQSVSYGLYIGGSALATAPFQNKILLNTYKGASSSLYVAQYAQFNDFYVNSRQDGYGSSVGSVFAIDVFGSNNKFNVSIQEQATPTIRGMVFRSGATSNKLDGYFFDTNLVQTYNDAGTTNYVNYSQGVPTSIASANGITIPDNGSLFNITGTTGIATITSAMLLGRKITLLFASVCNVVTSGNIKLAGSTTFTSTAGSTLTLVSNGTNWYEIGRAIL